MDGLSKVIKATGSAWNTRSNPVAKAEALTTMLALAVVAILALIAMLLLSDFPGEPEGTPNKAGAPPEDVRR
jgi:hypothetical protein